MLGAQCRHRTGLPGSGEPTYSQVMKPRPEHIRFEVPAAAAGQRVDRFLASQPGGLSRSRIQALIQKGHLRDQAGTLGDPAAKVKSSAVLVLEVPPPETASLEPQALDLPIVHEDDDLIVIDKPAGLVVHPAPGQAHGTAVNALIAPCGTGPPGIGGWRRPRHFPRPTPGAR